MVLCPFLPSILHIKIRMIALETPILQSLHSDCGLFLDSNLRSHYMGLFSNHLLTYTSSSAYQFLFLSLLDVFVG